jgi:hypothetical protein
MTLKPRQYKAIQALMTCRTLEDAAKVVKVTPRTLRNWLNDPEFLAELYKVEAAMLDETRRRLAAGRSQALDTLEDLIKSRSEATRRQAVNSWLDYDLKYGDRDVERRLAALEERIKDL